MNEAPIAGGDLWSAGRLDEGWLLLDVRTPGEFGEVHVAGSLNLPLADLQAGIDELSSRCETDRVAILCRTGQRAETARRKLVERGIDARVVEGGILEWQARGLPVRRGQAGVSLERQVRIAAGTLVLSGVLLGAWLHPGFYALSGFVGAGLVFAGVTDTCGMGMLLGRLPYNRRARGELAVAPDR